MWIELFTGLSERQFRKLVKAVRERGGDHPVLGRPWALTLEERVLLVAVYYRTNLTIGSWERCSESALAPCAAR